LRDCLGFGLMRENETHFLREVIHREMLAW
jgi:hypothetical protein